MSPPAWVSFLLQRATEPNQPKIHLLKQTLDQERLKSDSEHSLSGDQHKGLVFAAMSRMVLCASTQEKVR